MKRVVTIGKIIRDHGRTVLIYEVDASVKQPPCEHDFGPKSCRRCGTPKP